jgi:FtsP/CotA-like multicopper oxidase with cupredoxin domain
VRVPIQMDGVPEYSQPVVEPGQSFTYDFELHDASLFWYHPHVMSAAQVGFGLYGALLVEDPNDGVGIADQLVVVMSDISIDEQGKLESPESGGPAGMVFGREGNHTLINGRTSATLLAANGAPQRWRVVNAAKSRHFQLDLEGMVFTKIGADGGLQEYSGTSNRIVLAAGERADVIVQPTPAPTRELVLRHIPFNRGYGSVEYRDVEDLVTVKIAEGPAYAGPPPARITRAIEPVPQAGATRVNIAFTLAQLPDGSFEYGIDGSPFNKGRSLRAAVGETQIWTVTNKTKWSHPFHLHGFFFQVLDDKDQPVRPLAWKDTMNIPLETSMRFIVKFDDRPGRWMFHCHILDHAEGGLMSSVLVGPGDDVAPDHHHEPSGASTRGPGR